MSSVPTFASRKCWKVEEKEQRIENLYEKLMMEIVPNPVKKRDIQVQEAQGVPNKRNPKMPTRRHIIKMPKVKDKERILKAAREKQLVNHHQTSIT